MLIVISLALLAGCAENLNVTKDNCYKVLFVDTYGLWGYNLFDVQSLKTGDTLYIVSKEVKDSAVKSKDWIKIKDGTIINTLIMPVDSLVIMSGIRSIYPLDGFLDGKLFMRKDTMIARKYMTEDIRGLYIRKEKVRTIENNYFFYKQ